MILSGLAWMPYEKPMRNRPSWDQLFFTQAVLYANRSVDPSSQVGAVIVTIDNVPVSAGYNGPVRGTDLSDPENIALMNKRPDKYQFVEHGERNAIYNALRQSRSVQACTLYVTAFPCADCCRAICQSGITSVKVLKETNDKFYQRDSHFRMDDIILKMFRATGVSVEIVDVIIYTPTPITIGGVEYLIGE